MSFDPGQSLLDSANPFSLLCNLLALLSNPFALLSNLLALLSNPFPLLSNPFTLPVDLAAQCEMALPYRAHQRHVQERDCCDQCRVHNLPAYVINVYLSRGMLVNI